MIANANLGSPGRECEDLRCLSGIGRSRQERPRRATAGSAHYPLRQGLDRVNGRAVTKRAWQHEHSINAECGELIDHCGRVVLQVRRRQRGDLNVRRVAVMLNGGVTQATAASRSSTRNPTVRSPRVLSAVPTAKDEPSASTKKSASALEISAGARPRTFRTKSTISARAPAAVRVPTNAKPVIRFSHRPSLPRPNVTAQMLTPHRTTVPSVDRQRPQSCCTDRHVVVHA